MANKLDAEARVTSETLAAELGHTNDPIARLLASALRSHMSKYVSFGTGDDIRSEGEGR